MRGPARGRRPSTGVGDREESRAIESVFPTGPYKLGANYGNGVTLNPDSNELANPNFKDGKCDTTVP